MTVTPPRSETGEEELTRLRSELASLQAVVDDREDRRRRTLALRRAVASVLVVVTAFGVGLSVIGIWAARTALDTDRWVSTVGPLAGDERVTDAVADFVTAEVFVVLDAESRVADALPPRAAFLAAPLTNQVRDVVRETTEDVLASPGFRNAWEEANRLAHGRIVAIVEDRAPAVSVDDDTVRLNLLPAVNDVLRSLDARLPTLFGRDLDLPELQGGQLPEGLRDRIGASLGVTLPEDFAEITIYRADELQTLQDTVALSKRGLLGLVAGTLLAAGLALWVSPGRRRTALELGVWLAIAAVVLSAVVRTLRAQLIEQIEAGNVRAGVDAGLETVLTDLRLRADQVLWFGVALALVAYLVGPGRGAARLRRAAVETGHAFGRLTSTGRVRGPSLAREHLDALRFGGAAVAAVAALVLSSWPSLLLTATALAAYLVAVTLLAASAGSAPFTEPQPGRS